MRRRRLVNAVMAGVLVAAMGPAGLASAKGNGQGANTCHGLGTAYHHVSAAQGKSTASLKLLRKWIECQGLPH